MTEKDIAGKSYEGRVEGFWARRGRFGFAAAGVPVRFLAAFVGPAAIYQMRFP